MFDPAKFRYLILVLLLVPLCSHADRVILLPGDVLEGTILHETEETLTIRGPFGDTMLRKSDIKSVQRDDSSSAAAAAPAAQPTTAPTQAASAPSPIIQVQEYPAPAQQTSSQPAPAPTAAPQAVAPPAPSQPASPVTPPRQTAWPSAQPQPAAPTAPAPVVPSGPGITRSSAPDVYSLMLQNIQYQSQWKDLEIAQSSQYVMNNQMVREETLARYISPHYMRSKTTSHYPPNQQLPQGGTIEQDIYRAKGMMWQVVQYPGQPVQYNKVNLESTGQYRGEDVMQVFHTGFCAAGNDQNLVSAIAANTRLTGSETINGHDCWLLETRYSPQLIEAHLSRYPNESREQLRQQLSGFGLVKSWIRKSDTIQIKREVFDAQNQLIQVMEITEIRPNQGLVIDQLRMKVPPGTEFNDATSQILAQMQGGNANTQPQSAAATQQQPRQQQRPQTVQQQNVHPQAARPGQWNPNNPTMGRSQGAPQNPYGQQSMGYGNQQQQYPQNMYGQQQQNAYPGYGAQQQGGYYPQQQGGYPNYGGAQQQEQGFLSRMFGGLW